MPTPLNAKPRFWRPAWVERGVAQSTDLPVYAGDTATVTAPTISGSSYSLLKPDGTAAISAQAITIPGNVGLVSRSGALTFQIGPEIAQCGCGTPGASRPTTSTSRRLRRASMPALASIKDS